MKAASGDRMQAVGTRSELELKILLVGAPKSVSVRPDLSAVGMQRSSVPEHQPQDLL